MKYRYSLSVIGIILILAMLCSFLMLPVNAASEAEAAALAEIDPALPENKGGNYAERVFELLELNKYEDDSEFQPISYSELYVYYSSDDEKEDTPSYVLINVYTNIFEAMPVCEVFGDYLIDNSVRKIPYKLGYYIYVPKEDIIYDLSLAYKLQIEGIENVFTEAGVGRLIGDMDKDRKLTIKDATHIQKGLVGLIEFTGDPIEAFMWTENPPLKYVADFNRDCELNIKDATAIQKKLAGLPY